MKNLKPLWLSVSPNICSGYGRVTNEVGWRLASNQVDTMFFGLQYYGKPSTMLLGHERGPRHYRMCGTEDAEFNPGRIETLHYHMKNHGCNVLFTLWDTWILGSAYADNFPWIPYIPLDAPLTRMNQSIIRNCFRRITMSKFGWAELRDVGLESTYIPHGVDCRIYKPMAAAQRRYVRVLLGIDPDAFIFGTVGKNYFYRKKFHFMIEAFSLLKKRLGPRGKKIYLFMFTEKNPYTSTTNVHNAGFDMEKLARRYDVWDRLIFPGSLNVPDQSLAKIMGCFDIYLSTSGGEGFGLPIIEAMACQVPCIVPNNSAQPEHVAGHGWIAPCNYHIDPTSPNEDYVWGDIEINAYVDIMQEAFEDDEKRKSYGQASLEYARDHYDWNFVFDHYWYPFLQKLDEDIVNMPDYLRYHIDDPMRFGAPKNIAHVDRIKRIDRGEKRCKTTKTRPSVKRARKKLQPRPKRRT